jgi:hypothetical protein
MNVEASRECIASLAATAARDADSARVAEAIRVLANHYFDTRKGLSMRGVGGAPDWMGFESEIWRLSESVRGFLKARRDLKGRNPFMETILALATDRRFKKGRQNLVLLVGEFGDISFAKTLSGDLDDADVSGHAVKALIKLKAAGYADEVGRALELASSAWVKKAAKSYLLKFT